MKKKITIKDIAREAGVSVATVSYVVNNRTEERISEETRKKVLQIINLLNYSPNQSARALATSTGQSIALYLNLDVSVLRRAEQMLFINALEITLHDQNLNLVMKSNNFLERLDGVNAIICLDLPKELFLKIGDKNFVPLIAVDSLINDPLFFQINSDYQQIRAQADSYFGNDSYSYACLDISDQLLKDKICTVFSSVCFINSYSDYRKIVDPNLLITERTLDEIEHPGIQKKLFVNLLTDNKLKALMECIELATQRIPIPDHDIIIL